MDINNNVNINNQCDIHNDLTPIIVSNSYIKKYYLDSRLEILPKEVKDEVKRTLMKFTEEVGGIVLVMYDNVDNKIFFRVSKVDDDISYDEINASYKLSKLERENAETFEQIAEFCKFKFNGLV